MRRNALVLFSIIAAFDALAFYPIDPIPLRRLVMESEYIISGHAIEILIEKSAKGEYQTHKARVKVSEVLHGSLKETILEIKYRANMICPAPPMFVDNTDVIAFLNKDGNSYRIVGLSYGLKTLDSPGIEVYKTRIKEIQQITTLTDENDRFMQTVEWLVKCAESPATRWEGTYELSPSSDFMSFYSQTPPQPFYQMLTKEHKERLKVALLSGHREYEDFGLVDLVYADYRIEVRNYLLQGLQQMDDHRLWFADGYMRRLLYDNDSAELKKLADTFQDIQYKRGRESEMKAIIDEFVTLVAIK